MKFNQSLKMYIKNKTNLWNLIESMTSIDNVDYSSNDIASIIDNDESEKALIAIVLLWCHKNSPIQNIEKSNNSFIEFLKTIRNNDSDFFNHEIKWIYNDNNSCTFIKEDLLFIINDNDNTKRMQLPDEYCDKALLCLNCNEEINASYYIDVPDNTFYIIEIAE